MSILKYPSDRAGSEKSFVNLQNMKEYLTDRLERANETIMARVKKINDTAAINPLALTPQESIPVFESVYFSAADLQKVLQVNAQGDLPSGAFFYLKSIERANVKYLTLVAVGAKENGDFMTDAITGALACPPDCPVWRDDL